MKNKIAFFFLIVICAGLVFSGTIIVHKPDGSVPFKKGDTCNIKWTANNCSQTNYKINIFKGSVNQANFKLQLTANGTTSKNWIIPANLESGNYIIRIKAENSCKGNSAVFEIKNKVIFSGKLLKPPSKPTFKPPKGFLDPKIEFVIDHPLGALKPGTRVVVKGKNFGQNKGKVFIKGNFPGGQFQLENVDWDSNTRVLGYVPQSVNGQPNQPVKIVLVTSLNKKSNEWSAEFIGREVRWLSVNDVVLVRCGKDGNCNHCNNYSYGCEPWNAVAPISGRHINAYGTVGDDVGDDVYSIKLYNGWVFKEMIKTKWYKSSGDEVLSGPTPAFPTGQSTWKPSIHWKVSSDDTIWYNIVISVEGPIGTSYK